MALWRIGRGWSTPELERELAAARHYKRNFPDEGPESQLGTAWDRYYSESIIAREAPGAPVPAGPFEKAWKAIREYQFSDPGIVVGHFDPREPIEHRTMMLEIKAPLGLHYLNPVRVGAVRERGDASQTERSFRYDTLEGHIEAGSEWFVLTKKHDTGEVVFRISASWRHGEFPNWWSRLGFNLVGHRYQLAWHRLAYVRLREIAGGGADLVPIPYGEKLIHTGPEIRNSSLWILNEPSATSRVLQAGKDESTCPDSEETKSSSSPERQRA